jgi:hypothetical protein
MKIDTLNLIDGKWRFGRQFIEKKSLCQLVLVFGESDFIQSEDVFEGLRDLYPNAKIIGASSAGSIVGAVIAKTHVVATAVHLEKGFVELSTVDFSAESDIEAISANLLRKLPAEGLRHIFVLADGLNINGSELVKGLNKVTHGVSVTGGMAGDGDRFLHTWVVANAPACQNCIVAVGFYGADLVISTGSHGGWSSFGADRQVTRAIGNTLFELDYEPALDVYKRHLGEFAEDLPMSGMRFPLYIRSPGDSEGVIRTLMQIDEDAKSITFAGDIPEGCLAQLTKPDLHQLIYGAVDAAKEINQVNDHQALGLVVSCVGRRVVMKQIIEEELEAVEEILGANVELVGFYSYGELAPFNNQPEQCQLHNQTMTLTAIYEK